MKLVVIEDDEDIAHWLKPALGFISDDMEVATVTRNFDTLYHLEFWDGVDALLTDYMLPGFDITDFVKWLKKRRSHIRIVVFTAVEDEVLEEIIPHVDHILHKPATLSEIAKAVHI